LIIGYADDSDDLFPGNIAGVLKAWNEELTGVDYPPYDHDSLSVMRSSTGHSIALLVIFPTRTFLVVVATSWTIIGFLLLKKFVYCNLLYIS